MTDTPLRWGILGAGAIAATVGADIAATPANVLQAVGARDASRAAAFAAEHGVAGNGYEVLEVLDETRRQLGVRYAADSQD